MGRDETKSSSSKHKRSHDSEHDEKRKKRHKTREHGSKKEKKAKGGRIVDDDVADDDMWEEKNIDMDGERPLATGVPTAESLKLTSRSGSVPGDPPLPKAGVSESSLKRDEWMLEPTAAPSVPDIARAGPRVLEGNDDVMDGYGEPSANARTGSGSVDFFSGLGIERKKAQKPEPTEPKISRMELNTALKEGKTIDDIPTSTPKATTPGGPGSQWRMMKLRRVYESAEEEHRPVEEVALERFGSLAMFEEAQEERRILDERADRRASKGPPSSARVRGKEPEFERRYMFTDVDASGASSRSSTFRRPDVGDSAPGTPSPGSRPSRARYDSMRLNNQGGGGGSTLAQSHTPVPSVMTPTHAIPAKRRRALSPSSLNKLQAKVLRAKLMNSADAATLEKEYEAELAAANGDGADGDTQIEVLPTLDAQGRLYDVGQGKDDGAPPPPGNRKKKEKVVETRDPKTGDLVRINADDDEITLGEMLRQERFGAGAADQKNFDAELARRITTDATFQDNLDYMDDNAEKLGRKKMRSDAMKRQFAINDYKRTQKVMATCPFCYGEDDSLPKAAVVAMGSRAYLACTPNEELVPGHCLIVPIQHHLSMLEGDDDVWDEVRNFMKCLMRMFAEKDQGVVFYETVLTLKHQKHTFIECMPLPWEKFEEIPAYFRESILMSETEWSQHKKLIDFSARPGGFRRAMVPNLPYFMVQFDYKGEKGFGHVIEGTSEASGAGEEDGAIDEGEKGGGEFPRYFASEIIGNVLELEPRQWMRPRRIDFRHNQDRVAKFRKEYAKFDWTGMIERS